MLKFHWRGAVFWRGIAWLAVLAPYFYFTYGVLNRYTASLTDVPSFAYAWESQIPFLAWSIIPYWSINFLYGISLFICTTSQEQWRHGLRLLLSSALACVGFFLFPLKFSFPRPETEGFFGWWFTQLELFDMPFNQAPSLHIILAWVLFVRYAAHVGCLGRVLWGAWFALIGLSVLTTWQHHFIDIPTGLFVGLLVTYLVPMQGRWCWQKASKTSVLIGLSYLTLGLLLLFLIWLPYAKWLIWPATSCIIIAFGYFGAGASVFQKTHNGQQSLSAQILLLPYHIVARLTRSYYSQKQDAINKVSSGLYLGSYPQQGQFVGVLDLCAEYAASDKVTTTYYRTVPMLDLLAPSVEQLDQAVNALAELHHQGDTLVHCALGLSRSAVVVAAYLWQQDKTQSMDALIQQLKSKRANVLLAEAHLTLLADYQAFAK
ncbi:phosphatase PAP2/dual specificity phosphatase family protein [Pseudomonas sp. F1_0610]|uniref:phosphatase PAP2/dual specificity phosphatase family protein n=1 Tax=Pseudomonas sp. F1_0610 TaxID=3114284 RepID=UPI0039C437A2